MKEKEPLFWEIKIGNRTAHNRIALNAMECNDADKEGNPTELTLKRYRKAVKGNAGVIVIEAISVIDESRGRLNQLIGMPANQKALGKMIDELKKVNNKPLLFIQLTHSGELSEPQFSRRVCVKPLPGFGGDLLSEEEVEKIIEKFVLAARVAHDAGADGIDVKLCHGYLGSQFLRPYNDRKWKYGGSWENRTRFAYEIYERIAKEIQDPNFVVGSKISVWEGFPGGVGTVGPDSPVMDITESLDLVQGLEARTLALTQPDRNIPDYAYLHFYFQQMVKNAARSETVVIGGAYSVFRNGQNKFLAVNREQSSFVYWGNKNIKDGVCDMVAVGRQSLADSLMPGKLEAGKPQEVDWCTCCDNCIEFLIRQKPVGCATYDKEYARAFKELRKEQGKLAEKHT
jgi:2,4-dienoyl-CoA reductase-like NADH-dependent reductase (Old Yellow Enzyme family)